MSDIDVEILTDAITVEIVTEQGAPGADGVEATVSVELTGTQAALSCVAIRNLAAYPITSVDASAPICDGILLEGGTAGDVVLAAILRGYIFTISGTLPGANGDVLWMGQSGELTDSVPSVTAGDAWDAPIARKIAADKFELLPSTLIKLA